MCFFSQSDVCMGSAYSRLMCIGKDCICVAVYMLYEECVYNVLVIVLLQGMC